MMHNTYDSFGLSRRQTTSLHSFEFIDHSLSTTDNRHHYLYIDINIIFVEWRYHLAIGYVWL